MPLSPLLKRDRIGAPAETVIRFLEKRIKNDFHISGMKFGFEKEGLAQIGDGSRREFEEYLDDFEDMRKEQFEEIRDSRLAALPYATLKGRREERYTRPTMQRIETEHGDNQLEFKTYPAHSAVQAVKRMDAQTTLVESYSDEGLMYANRHLNREEREIRDWPSSQFQSISFKPYNGHGLSDDGVNGLHVNISLWQKNKNLCATPAYANRLMENVKANLMALCQTDLILIAPTKAAHDRLNHYFSGRTNDIGQQSHQKMAKISVFSKNSGMPREAIREKKRNQLARMEFRLPSSDARHDLSMMVVLASVYEGLIDNSHFQPYLEKRDLEMDESRFHYDYMLSTNFKDSCRRFEQGSRLFDMLRKMAAKEPEVLEAIDTLETEIKTAIRTNKLAQPTIKERASMVR